MGDSPWNRPCKYVSSLIGVAVMFSGLRVAAEVPESSAFKKPLLLRRPLAIVLLLRYCVCTFNTNCKNSKHSNHNMGHCQDLGANSISIDSSKPKKCLLLQLLSTIDNQHVSTHSPRTHLLKLAFHDASSIALQVDNRGSYHHQSVTIRKKLNKLTTTSIKAKGLKYSPVGKLGANFLALKGLRTRQYSFHSHVHEKSTK